MAKDKIAYVCSNCGQESPKWIGKCPACGQWNTFQEIKIAATKTVRGARLQANSQTLTTKSRDVARVLRLSDINATDDPRIDMQDEELNRVLGGGLVPGSIVLLGGEPGIGKSTLSLQTMLRLPQRVLYVSGEESAHQLKMRAERLSRVGGFQTDTDDFLLLCENQVEIIFDHIKEVQPQDQRRTCHPHRTHHQGGHTCWTKDSRAHRRHRHPIRGRPTPHVPHPSGNKKSLWLNLRTGHI